MNKMFCFQCQQTAHNTGCEGNAGVCGKKCGTANAQDALTNALIGLARAVNKKTPSEQSDRLVLKGLFTTITNVNFHEDNVRKLTQEIQAERNAIDASAEEYDIRNIWENHEDIRSLKSLILFGLRGMAAYAYHALALGYTDRDVLNYFYEALAVLGEPSDTSKENFERLLSYVLKTGEVNYRCMELLDKANTESYGTPVPTEVPLTIEKGPFIVVSGHDLHDLKLLLEQTNDTGINIYTHSEMLPAHGYPELKKYPHLKGNFGTAWQNQQFEFHNIPAPILFTTNCLMPVRQSYCDRVFTTSIVSYPELIHIGEEKDFTPVIEKALECGGYGKDHPMYGVNGGNTVMTGFAHGTVLKEAGRIINLVKNGKIRHFFLIGGCDGAAPGRNYYTEFAKKTLEKLSTHSTALPAVPGNRPYREAEPTPIVPATNENCTHCGLCAAHCPVGAIDPAEPSRIDPARCILCMRCVNLCPVKAKDLPSPVRENISKFLSQFQSNRRQNELFL